MLGVLNRIVASGAEVPWGVTWMEHIRISDLLLLSMMADMAQTGIELTRFFDREDVDVALMNEKVYHFVTELEVRFFFVKRMYFVCLWHV